MTYCFHCGKYTPGKPLFCSRCGRSYDVRLCPRLHPNPRNAEVCSQCGSREFSEPQPRVPLWRKALAWLFRVTLGSVLALVSLVAILALLAEALQQRAVQSGLVGIGILLIGCWFLWTWLPHWLRDMIRKALRRKDHRNER